MCLAAFFLVLIVMGTSKNRLISNTTKQLQPSDLRAFNSEPFEIKGGGNMAINVHGTEWVYVSGLFLDDKDKPVPDSDFGVYTGETVYLSALPAGKYHLQLNSKWKNSSAASPSFAVESGRMCPTFLDYFGWG